MTVRALALALVLAPLAASSAGASSTSLERLAHEVVQTVIVKHLPAPMGVYVEGAAVPLQRALASLVSAELAAAGMVPVVVEAASGSGAEHVARELGVASLLRLSLTRDAARLDVRGDAFALRVSFWSADLPTRAGAVAVVALSGVADAQALMLEGTAQAVEVAPLDFKVVPLARLVAVPAALAIGDLDADKKAELIVLSQDRLLVFSAEGRVVARAELSTALSNKPTREPWGLLAVANGRVQVWSGRREKPELFSMVRGVLKSLGPLDAIAFDGLSCRLEAGVNRTLSEVMLGGKAVQLPVGVQGVSTVASAGVSLLLFANATASVWRGAGPLVGRVNSVGSGSVVADVDHDGVPEIVATSAKTSGEVDEVRVLSVTNFEQLQTHAGVLAEAPVAWQQSLKGRAVVAAAGDLDGDGADEVVLGLWQVDGGELVLLKRVAP